MKRQELLALIFLLLLASFFRFYRLGEIPFGLNNDAAWEGSAAQGWRGEGLLRLIVASFTLLLGPQPLAIKLPSAIWGWLTIVPLYFLVRHLFDQKLAWAKS